MTTLEMHIDFRAGYQSQGSNVNREWESPEIDRLLNNATRDYIERCCNPKNNNNGKGFEENQYKLDNIKELLRTTLVSPLFKKEDKILYGFLPSNYYKLIADNSLVKSDCKPLSLVTSTYSLHYTFVPFNDSASSFIDWSITSVNPTETLSFSMVDYYPTGIDNKRKFEIINWICEAMSGLTTQCYFENFNDKFYKNKFIIVTKEACVVTVQDGTEPAPVVYNSTSIFYYTYTAIAGNGTFVPNRLSSNEGFRNLLNNSLTNTLIDSPISFLENDKIQVCIGDDFVIEQIELVYIKKHRLLSLDANINPELKEEACKSIVLLAVLEAMVNTGNRNIESNLVVNKFKI